MRLSAHKLVRIVCSIIIIAIPFLTEASLVHAGTFTGASLQLSDSRPSQTSVTYNFGFTTTVTTAIKQLDIQICTTATGTCTGPTSFNVGSPTIGSDNLAGTGRTASAPTSNAFRVVVTTPSAQSSQSATISFTGVTNPNSAGTWYARITTYSDTGSTVIDSATVAFATTTGIVASVTVDPTLTFAVNAVNSGQSINGGTTTVTTTSSTIPFGSVSTSANGIAANSLVVTTNAQSGYTVYIKYTGAPSDGNGHTIADVSGATNASPATFSSTGTSAFGYTTESTTLSGTGSRFGSSKYAAFTSSNQEVARATTAVSSDTTKIGYQVGIGGTQAAGTYTTTVILTATPTY